MTNVDLLEGLILPEDAASSLDCNPRTLKRYENEPDGLESYLIAGRKYYDVEELKKFLRRRKRRPNPRRAR